MEAAQPTEAGPRPLPFPLPLSFGGVAAIAVRRVWCLLGWQFVIALLVGSGVAWAFHLTWGRALTHAIQSLPDRAGIREGRLAWPTPDRAVLHQGPFLGLVVDPPGRRESSLASDVTVILEPEGMAFRSLLGWTWLPYPPGLDLPLGRLEAGGVLAAWETPALLALGAAAATAVLAAWWSLSLAYGCILWACAGMLGRRAGFAVAWRTAGAALLAPALLMTGALLLYATRSLTFVGFLLALPLHLVAGWLYCAGGLTRLPTEPGPAFNPFGNAPAPPRDPMTSAADPNPFRTS
jgi:hypothetical protein